MANRKRQAATAQSGRFRKRGMTADADAPCFCAEPSPQYTRGRRCQDRRSLQRRTQMPRQEVLERMWHALFLCPGSLLASVILGSPYYTRRRRCQDRRPCQRRTQMSDRRSVDVCGIASWLFSFFWEGSMVRLQCLFTVLQVLIPLSCARGTSGRALAGAHGSSPPSFVRACGGCPSARSCSPRR